MKLSPRIKAKFASIFILTIIIAGGVLQSVSAESTQTISGVDTNANPNDTNFKLVVCDGPTLPNIAPAHLLDEANKERRAKGLPDYVACDFNGVMKTVQHLINILMVLGVFVAVGLFSYGGALMITGKPENMNKARSFFPKVFGGFIIMLSAWFIVYQILDWLTNNQGFKTLLGNP